MTYSLRSHPVARSRRTLVIGLAVTLLITAVVAIGCGSGSSTPTTSPAGSTTVSTSPTTTAGGPTTTAASSSSTTVAGGAKLAKITLVAPPGPMAIPMAYIAANNLLSAVADKTDVVVWENPTQLQAMVAGKQGDFVTMPSNNAAIFYNKGVSIKLLDITVWNITYLVSSDASAKSFADIKGQSIAVPFQGSVPDLMFQYIAKKEGLDPQKDFTVRYATDPTQASQLLLAGKVQNAVLSEPMATASILQSQNSKTKLYRALSFDAGWQQATGGANLSPIAGTVATATMLDKPAVIADFLKQYQVAVAWMLANPEAAGKLIETQFPQLGLKAAPMTASLKNITWKFTPAADARKDVDTFLAQLATLSPEVIGGKVPDAGFYYAP